VPLKFSVIFYDFLGNHDSIANPYLIWNREQWQQRNLGRKPYI
jgi:hypothetical protein